MSTTTQTHTRTDIRKVFEPFQADLQMLAVRTQAMELDHARKCGDDISLMAQEQCLTNVHIQLFDSRGKLVRVHLYSVKEGVLSDSQRPGENRWPCLPDGTLRVIILYSDAHKLEELERSGKLKINWSPSNMSTDYSRMQKAGNRLYSSNSYGLLRDTFVN